MGKRLIIETPMVHISSLLHAITRGEKKQHGSTHPTGETKINSNVQINSFSTWQKLHRLGD